MGCEKVSQNKNQDPKEQNQNPKEQVRSESKHVTKLLKLSIKISVYSGFFESDVSAKTNRRHNLLLKFQIQKTQNYTTKIFKASF